MRAAPITKLNSSIPTKKKNKKQKTLGYYYIAESPREPLASSWLKDLSEAEKIPRREQIQDLLCRPTTALRLHSRILPALTYEEHI